MKRALSIVLVLVLLVSIAPMSVFAADNGYAYHHRHHHVQRGT